MEWTIFSRQSNFSHDFYGCIVGINILFFLWIRMGLLWFLLGIFMVVGQQRKKILFSFGLKPC